MILSKVNLKLNFFNRTKSNKKIIFNNMDNIDKHRQLCLCANDNHSHSKVLILKGFFLFFIRYLLNIVI